MPRILHEIGTLVLQLPGRGPPDEVLPRLRHDPTPAMLGPRDHAGAIRGIQGCGVHIRGQRLLLVIPQVRGLLV
jgi:hypothetical protein